MGLLAWVWARLEADAAFCRVCDRPILPSDRGTCSPECAEVWFDRNVM